MISFSKDSLPEKIQRLLKQSLKCIKLLQTELLITSTKSKSLYYISFRIVSFVLPNGNTEVVYTNLPKEDFSTEELRELYNMRWGIETSFRDIKYAAGLLFFHSRKKDLVIQEIYAKLILYNFCELITGAIVVEKRIGSLVTG